MRQSNEEKFELTASVRIMQPNNIRKATGTNENLKDLYTPDNRKSTTATPISKYENPTKVDA